MTTRRVLYAGAAALVLVALFVVLRRGEDESAGPAVPSAATAAASPPAAPATTPADTPETAPPADTWRTFRIRVAGGRPEGGIRRIAVKQGDRVALVVRADVQETVHLHGYDIERAVGPGAPAQLRFEAELPGRFEVELEESGVALADLSVTP